ncbi:hypothetical protein D3C76_1162540 [compost metagenome]
MIYCTRRILLAVVGTLSNGVLIIGHLDISINVVYCMKNRQLYTRAIYKDVALRKPDPKVVMLWMLMRLEVLRPIFMSLIMFAGRYGICPLRD